MPFARHFYVSLTLGLATLGGDSLAWAESAPTVQRRIETVIASAATTEPDRDGRVLREFYRTRSYHLAWTGPRAASGSRLLEDLPAVATAEGLDRSPYAVPSSFPTDIEADISHSRALLRLGRDIAIGRVDPDRAFGGFGGNNRNGFDGTRFLRGLADGKTLAEQAAAVQPPFVGYLRLKEGLERLQTIARAGGWPIIPEGAKLVPLEAVDDRLPVLRRRLIVSGDLDPALAEGTTYDAPVVEAVKRFQRRHGLDPDGTIGARSLAALNVPVEVRLRQITANLERWRWMPHQLGRLHVSVNIPAASLDLVEDGAVAMTMRVVVGDTRHPTPSMDTSMSSVVLNPPWSVPSSIANNEILPKLRRDPNYLATSNLQIADYPEDSPEAAGDGIDWNAIGKKFPYRLRQPPGPDNALGQLKFNLRNADDIYLHDTPNHRAFSRAYRALSHGCIRLEEPVALGEMLLGSRWKSRLSENLNEDKKTRTLKLERNIPVYLIYFTAWVDPTGEINFRDDIYGHDRRLGQALRQSRIQAKPRPASPPA
ncbi:L,D-transpeptidase family protein [Magnetospirillum fulvum]|uniref:Murein L,D-transpeptidase YcbB/YkuD n=1 Tax=Magnetospirillum fulvum TaxID=1082 RepID=A0A1H6HUA4_MAGFU|nr:L,D-transpeptidase family protein [Magnetospirillum fulvum]SEH37705.1 Murein L,D-transpeptidase YcbB/YkuD [Magnetospirillum fulvum]